MYNNINDDTKICKIHKRAKKNKTWLWAGGVASCNVAAQCS